MQKEELALVPTADLLEEVMARFDAAVFGAVRHQTANADAEAFVSMGSAVTCMGLGVRVVQHCRERCDHASERDAEL